MGAIVLLSGGIDSCVSLAYALSSGRSCTTLSFDYGQRHLIELQYAEKIAAHYSVLHITLRLDPLLFSNTSDCSLTNRTLGIDTQRDNVHPNTYVPCRNLLFLSHAASLAESVGATEIFFGAHHNDSPSYPDCTLAFFQAFEQAVKCGSYVGTAGLRVFCPLIDLDKASVIAMGKRLNAPLDLTWSCYNPQEIAPCNACPACALRAEGFGLCDQKDFPIALK